MRRQRLGLTDLPPPLPHPDHVVIDIRAGKAAILGPATKEELAQWQQVQAHAEAFQVELDELQAQLADPTCIDPEGITREIERTQTVLRILRAGA